MQSGSARGDGEAVGGLQVAQAAQSIWLVCRGIWGRAGGSWGDGHCLLWNGRWGRMEPWALSWGTVKAGDARKDQLAEKHELR